MTQCVQVKECVAQDILIFQALTSPVPLALSETLAVALARQRRDEGQTGIYSNLSTQYSKVLYMRNIGEYANFQLKYMYCADVLWVCTLYGNLIISKYHVSGMFSFYKLCSRSERHTHLSAPKYSSITVYKYTMYLNSQ